MVEFPKGKQKNNQTPSIVTLQEEIKTVGIMNDTLYDNANLKTPTNIESIQIGSVEGITRSNANNYHIEIRSKQ